MSAITKKKTELRQHFLKVRADLKHPYREIAATQLCDQFLEHIPYSKKDTVSGYYPTNSEISPMPLMRELASRGLLTTLPVVTDQKSPLLFNTWKEGEPLHTGLFFDIREPRSNPATPTIMLVPLLAFDKKGYRLGYGGGFYDRTITFLRQSKHTFLSVGLAFASQHSDSLPHFDHDEPLDYVVTDEKVWKF